MSSSFLNALVSMHVVTFLYVSSLYSLHWNSNTTTHPQAKPSNSATITDLNIEWISSSTPETASYIIFPNPAFVMFDCNNKTPSPETGAGYPGPTHRLELA